MEESDPVVLGELVKVAVSCIPGLEFITVSECNEKFGVESQKENRGRVSFTIPVHSLKLLTTLRSVHHYWLVVSELTDLWSASDDKNVILEKLEACINTLPWQRSLAGFNYFKNLDKKESNKVADPVAKKQIDSAQQVDNQSGLCVPESSSECKSDILNTPKEEEQCSPQLKKKRVQLYTENPDCQFRVTCTRNGTHEFTSTEAAKYIGSGVKGHFNWNVNLEKFDVEILAFIEASKVTIAMKLSNESKHNRNITCFGPTTLKATTAFCLLKLAGVKKGDIVCDPMCGSGAICLEGASGFPFSFQLGGENHGEGCEKARKNFENLEKHFGETTNFRNFSFPHTILQWDARRMPLREGLVDVLVCDMPFGKRMGYKGRNFQLYPAILQEMGRISRPHGKAVLLTKHKSAMNKALKNCSLLWKKQASFFINMGGLNVGIYVLKRIVASKEEDLVRTAASKEEDLVRIARSKEDLVRNATSKEDLIRTAKSKEDLVRTAASKEDLVRTAKSKEDLVRIVKSKEDLAS